MKSFSALFAILIFLASCSTPDKIYRSDTSALAATELKIPELKKKDPGTKEESKKPAIKKKTDEGSDESEEGALYLVEADQENPEEEGLYLDGVAVPELYALKDTKTYVLKDAGDTSLDQTFFDFPVIYNQQVEKWISYFTNRGRKYFELYIERAGRYAPVIGEILEKNGLPRDLIFLAMAESGFNNRARSHARAVGPWQFMPATGKDYSLKQNWYVDERRDPIKATVAAAQYLSKLYNDFGDWEVATAAYNAGEGKLGRAIRKYKTKDFWKLTKGRYLKSETKNYVPKIMALAIIGKNLNAFGFKDLDFHAPLSYEEVEVAPSTDIYKLAEVLKVEISEIQRLNPELLRWFTPPDIANYKIRVPKNAMALESDCCTASEFQLYTLTKKMSLSQLSQKFRIKNTYVLSHLNNASSKKHFQRVSRSSFPLEQAIR